MKIIDGNNAPDNTLKTWSSLSSPPAPPPPPPPPTFSSLHRRWTGKPVKSITKEEIEKFWWKKKMIEEEHFLAAVKAAARIRARKMTDEDFRKFMESLKEDEEDDTSKKNIQNGNENRNEEIRIGIKDWWTKSRYAYLNQPALQSTEPPKRSSTYIPNFFVYKPPPPSLGVF